jgi:hypothetical protein
MGRKPGLLIGVFFSPEVYDKHSLTATSPASMSEGPPMFYGSSLGELAPTTAPFLLVTAALTPLVQQERRRTPSATSHPPS